MEFANENSKVFPRWLLEVAFMLAMASTGKDRYSQRCVTTQ